AAFEVLRIFLIATRDLPAASRSRWVHRGVGLRILQFHRAVRVRNALEKPIVRPLLIFKVRKGRHQSLAVRVFNNLDYLLAPWKGPKNLDCLGYLSALSMKPRLDALAGIIMVDHGAFHRYPFTII